MTRWRKPVQFLPIFLFTVTTLTFGQTLEGQFYPEKKTYLIGEPIIVIAEVTNEGKKLTRIGEPSWGIWDSDRHVWEYGDLKINVENANRIPEPNWDQYWGCHLWVLDFAITLYIEILPRESWKEPTILNRVFRIDSPGEYKISASGVVKILSKKRRRKGSVKFKSSFTITVKQGTTEELKVAFKPYLKELSRSGEPDSTLAFRAITQTAPLFLEPFFLQWVQDHPFMDHSVLKALHKLNTPTAHKTIMDYLKKSSETVGRLDPDQFIPGTQAIQFLASTRDPRYLPALRAFALQGKNDLRLMAIAGVGRLGGEESILFLESILKSSDARLRQWGACGLGNTGSRKAVPILISALSDLDPDVREKAAGGISLLTHRFSGPGVWQPEKAAHTSKLWKKWWDKNGSTAEIYRPEEYHHTKRKPLF